MTPKQSLLKTARCGTALLVLLAWGASAQAQAFTETFGNTAGRVSSPYEPSGFTYSGSGDVDDGFYTVTAPASLGGTSTPGQTWWDTTTGDHTGDAGGAVLVVNAGNELTDMYQRDFTVAGGRNQDVEVLANEASEVAPVDDMESTD